jgi:hypothetical protein
MKGVKKAMYADGLLTLEKRRPAEVTYTLATVGPNWATVEVRLNDQYWNRADENDVRSPERLQARLLNDNTIPKGRKEAYRLAHRQLLAGLTPGKKRRGRRVAEITYVIDEAERCVYFLDWPFTAADPGTLLVRFDDLRGKRWRQFGDPGLWPEGGRTADKLAALRIARDELIDRGHVDE